MDIESFLDRELNRLRYRPKTIARYKACIRQLLEYFPNTGLEDISMRQIEEYVLFLMERRRLSKSTVRQVIAALEVVYNRVYKKNYDIKSLRLRKWEPRPTPEILSEREVLAVLDNTRTLKQRVILTLIYAAGLEVSEAVRLKVKDIDFKHKRTCVKQIQGRKTRYAVLADSLIDDLESYLQAHKPKDWLFEGRDAGSRYSVSAVQRAFRKALHSAGIDKQVSVKTLKYCYVKHLERQGVPLKVILTELDLSGQSLEFYTRLDVRDVDISHSPLDRIVLDYKERVDTASLEQMLTNVQNEDERDYLLEAMKCISARAYRAAVVFGWTAAIRNIHHRCLRHSLSSLNQFIKKHKPKAKEIRKLDDFAYVNDQVILNVSQDLGEFDKNETAILGHCLDLRNKCGHPGKYRPEALRVTAFMEDLVTVVFAKP